MAKTETSTVKLTAREQQLKDKARAEQVMKAFVGLKREQAELQTKIDHITGPIKRRYEEELEKVTAVFKDKTAALKASIESAENELVNIGGKADNKGKLINRALFTDDNWHFEDADGHYLHIKSEAKVKTGPEFSLPKFIRKFGEYVDVKYKIAQLKKVFTDGDQRKKFMALDFDLKNEESVEIKQKAEKA